MTWWSKSQTLRIPTPHTRKTSWRRNLPAHVIEKETQALLFFTPKPGVPLTTKTLEYRAWPTGFVATHEYSPLWRKVTASIVSTLLRCMILDVVTPSDDISAPFICQTILNGISPLGTMHDIWANAPTFCADSSNLNGKICGSSNNIKKKKKKTGSQLYSSQYPLLALK